MTRVLRRPMFRLGGNTDQGIMSGVVPRQGFSTGLSDELRQKKIRDVLSGDTTLGEAQDLSRSLAYQPRGVTPADALIEFGLNVASAEPRGSIFSTAAESAKEPFQRYSKSKAESEAARYVSEADMFKSLIESGAKATGEGTSKGWLEQWKFKQIPMLNKQINALTQKKRDGTIKPEEELELQSLREQKGRLVKLDPLTESWAKSENAAYAIQQEALNLIRADRQKPENERKYPPSATEGSIEVVMDAIRIVKQKLQEGSYNEGGRVGYQAAGPVMGQPKQADAMPEELGGVSYEELRARLPQEVSDEVVRLLANSPEALEDFAVIQTEQDISNFNKKYGVNLVLPAEG